jgi:hypothetical protein
VAQTRVGRSLASIFHHHRRIRAPRWWQEIAFIAVVYYLYSLVRNAVPSVRTGAFSRAHAILSIESDVRINIEHSVNHFVAAEHWLAYICNYYYATLHFVVTIAVLAWVYAKHPLRYRAMRNVLLITNLVALIGFWLISVAPPRMLSGYVDTVVHFHTWGSLASPGLAKESNQFAAMPSLHIGWALWCALAIVTLADRNWVRVLGALYPVATFLVIVGTANHYVLDAVGGAVTVGIAALIQRALSGRRTFARHIVLPPDMVPEETPTDLVSAGH